MLETRGVPVVAYGSDIVPAFWSRKSPYAAPLRLDQRRSDRAAVFHRAQRLASAAACWWPTRCRKPTRSRPKEMAGYIEAAQKAAEAQNISGKAVTPFLLAKILELTNGASLKTNIALVENNARLAARIAKAL